MNQGWTITVDAAGTGPAVTDDAIDTFLTNLEPHAGAVSIGHDGRRYTATFSLDEPDLDAQAAIDHGCTTFEKLAHLAGLPGWPIVHASAMTYEEHDRQLAEPVIPELVGIAEVAELLGVNRQRASALQTRAGFPAPVAVLRSGPVWARASLDRFNATWTRKPGRPRKDTTAPAAATAPKADKPLTKRRTVATKRTGVLTKARRVRDPKTGEWTTIPAGTRITAAGQKAPTTRATRTAATTKRSTTSRA